MPFPNRLAVPRQVRLHRGPTRGRSPNWTLPAFPARAVANCLPRRLRALPLYLLRHRRALRSFPEPFPTYARIVTPGNLECNGTEGPVLGKSAVGVHRPNKAIEMSGLVNSRAEWDP